LQRLFAGEQVDQGRVPLHDALDRGHFAALRARYRIDARTYRQFVDEDRAQSAHTHSAPLLGAVQSAIAKEVEEKRVASSVETSGTTV
jgi:hypothetical protein